MGHLAQARSQAGHGLMTRVGASAGAGEAASRPEAGASPAPPAPKTFEKPPEVVAFEAGKEIMDLLRNKHPHAITALELMMTEIGARRLRSSGHAPPELWHS